MLYAVFTLIGFIIGLLVSALIMITLGYFRAGIEHRMKIIERQLTAAGPKPQGVIFLPDDDATLVRNEIIKRNREAGRDTRIEELQ